MVFVSDKARCDTGVKDIHYAVNFSIGKHFISIKVLETHRNYLINAKTVNIN